MITKILEIVKKGGINKSSGANYKRYARGEVFGFQKGHKPFKGIEKTQFKKGQKSWNKGKTLSEETKRKISLANTDRKHTEEWKEKVSKKMKGRILSKDHKNHLSQSSMGHLVSDVTKKKIGLANKGRIVSIKTRLKQSKSLPKGKNHPNWKGGITSENQKIRQSIEYRLWREAVFARDNWTCQKTGERGGKLHPHHIQNFADFPELRTSISNGITLSEKAHHEFHSQYGTKNNTREQLNEFLQ